MKNRRKGKGEKIKINKYLGRLKGRIKDLLNWAKSGWELGGKKLQ